MAAVWYDFDAASNGSGASDLSPKNTWATPSNGDVIYIKPGNRWVRSTQLNLSTFTGLTFEPWPSWDGSSSSKPVIAHSAASTFVWNFQGDGVHTIKNLVFRDCSSNANGGVLGSGLVSATSVYAQLDLYGVEFYGISANAVRMSGTGAAAAPFFRALHCIWDDIGEDAIYGGSLRYEVGFCAMRRLSTQTTTGDGVGFLGVDPTYAYIHDSYIDRSNNDYKHAIIIDGTDGSGYVLVARNYLVGYGDETTPASGQTVVNIDQCRGDVIGNRIRSAGIALTFNTNGCSAKGNIFDIRNYRDSSTASLSVSASNTGIYNNTFDSRRATGGPMVKTATSASGNDLRNNIAIGGSLFFMDGAGASSTRNFNCVYDVDSDYEEDGAGSIASGAQDVTTDPLLNEDYSLKSGSPCLNAGTRIDGVVLKDFYGKDIVDVPDIGAVQVYAARSVSAARGTSAARAAVARNPVTDRAPYG